MPGGGAQPFEVPPTLWQRPDMVDALHERDIARVFQLVRQYTGLSQTRIGTACGFSQGKVSEILGGDAQVRALEVFDRIAHGLGMPDAARMALGLAPAFIPARDAPYAHPLSTRPLSPTVDLSHEDEDEDDDPVRRREFVGLAGTALFSAVLSGARSTADLGHGIEDLAAAITDYPTPGRDASAPLDLSPLAAAVADAKRTYQACQYSGVVKILPSLLRALRVACQVLEGDDRLRANALSAEAHHVAASILLKHDDKGLAWLAADRSLSAAHASESPLMIGSSARIITHALMNGGHHTAAKTTASAAAARMDADLSKPGPEDLSVYGSLLLRGAIAAAQQGDRRTTTELVAEAAEAGHRLGGDHNHMWTAFGPTNVLLHRVNVALTLGDLGVAIQEARKVNLDRIEVTERKATLLLDTSKAFLQWGKHDRAYQVLRAAHQIAPEEITVRPSTRRLLRDLLTTAPPSIRREVREFTEQIGVGQ